MSETFLDGKVTLLRGDCLELLPTLGECSIDSCVTDPPYHLTSIVKRYSKGDAKTENSIKLHGTQAISPYMRGAKGFMGKQWDGGDIAFRPELWAEVLRVLKPGAHLLAFSGTRTYHRMACAIEDAGFEIRDQIGWCYGSGFPKSHDVSKGIDRIAGAEREIAEANPNWRNPDNNAEHHERWNQAVINYFRTNPATEAAMQWQGWGTALKPAWEPIVLARKPISESSIAANVLKWGTGAINVDGCRVGIDERHNPSAGNKDLANRHTVTPISKHGETDGRICLGRWPANLIHDGSEEVVERFPDAPGQQRATGPEFERNAKVYGKFAGVTAAEPRGDSGSAARFFASFPITDEDLSWSHRANDAEPCSLQCRQRGENTVPESALRPALRKLAKDVKAAGRLCDSCATDFALMLAEVRRSGRLDKFHITRSIATFKETILRQCLASHVEGRESTDTILTIPNLTTLFGSALHAIAANTNLENREPPGSAEPSRFWYTSKADADDRLGSKHPTVKPLDLIQYLARLVTPKGGTILDPFAGTGTAGEAAYREGFAAVLIEREAEYQADIVKRMGLCLSGPDERRAASVKQLPPDDLPIFGGAA